MKIFLEKKKINKINSQHKPLSRKRQAHVVSFKLNWNAWPWGNEDEGGK